MALKLSWLERRPVTAKVVGSSPISVAIVTSASYCRSSTATRCARHKRRAKVAQSVEHAPEKRGVGSSILPLGTILFPERAVEELYRVSPSRFGMLAVVVAEAALAGFARVVKTVLRVVSVKFV